MITPKRIDLLFADASYFAEYPFLNDHTGYLTEVPDAFFQLMLYLLLYRMDTVELPEPVRLTDPGKTIVSYSGGTDSTALLYITNGVPVHITRSYQPLYENRQVRACNHVGAKQIITDFERVREKYVGRHGFNVGIGYGCMYLPVLNLLGCSKIAFGVVFDDLAFHYGSEFKYNNTFHDSGLYMILQELRNYGIEFTLPLAGHSEVLTIDLAKKSGIKGYSSCHTVGDDNACRECYKCFRKEAIRGNPLPWDEAVQKKIMPILKKKPLKMAASTVYAIQKAGYTGMFDRYMDIDVGWCERVNKPITMQFGGERSKLYSWQTDEDAESIRIFVETMNKEEMYYFLIINQKINIMKKLLLLMFIALAIGCQTSKFFKTVTYLLDFRSYAEKGFYMSTAGINQQYMPVGEITVVCHDGYDMNTVKIKKNEAGGLYGVIRKNSQKIKCTPEILLEQLYNEAKNLGANGVINIQIIDSQYKGVDSTKKMTITGLLVKID